MAFEVNNQAHINTVWLGWQFEVNSMNHWSTHALEKQINFYLLNYHNDSSFNGKYQLS
jgi:hypothetical protein